MRRTICLLACAVFLAVVGVATAVTVTRQFRGSLSGATHSPTVNQRWTYTISARTLKGKRLRASAHIQVFERGKRVDIIGWRQFTGTLRGSHRWSPSTRGHTYTFQAVLIATGANKKKSQLRLNYGVSPK